MNYQAQVLDDLAQGKTLSQAEAIHDIVTYQEPNLNNKSTHARYELNEVQA